MGLPTKIISGGQTGVDRAALDFAIKYNISHGGYCPKGRLAEDGRIPSKYQLKETTSNQYQSRTKKNVINADATLIFHTGQLGTGSKLTEKYCKEANKLYRVININDFNIDKIKQFVNKMSIRTINIAGSRGSSSPGLSEQTIQTLEAIWEISE